MLRPFPPLATLCALILLLPGCGRKTPATATWENAGFMKHAPADTEGFLALRQPVQRWRDIRPAWDALLSDPALRASWSQSAWGQVAEMLAASEPLSALGKTFAAIGDDEYFLALGRGTASRLASVQQVKHLFEAARLQNLFTPPLSEDVPPELAGESAPDANPELAAFTEVAVPLSPAMEAALQKFVQDFSIPPLLLGAKLRENSGPVPDFFKAWADGLPEKFPRKKFMLPPHGEFMRVRIQIAHLLPPGAAKRGRDALAATIGDPYAATNLLRALISKPVVITFGRAFGCFLVAVGPDDALPALTENVESSLAALPALAPIAPRTGDETAALFYADTLIIGLTASPPPVGKYLDAALESALEFAPAARIEPLRAAAASLRHQAEELFQPGVAAACGVITRKETGWSADMFGGPLAPRLARKNSRPLLEMNPAWALLWTEQWQDGYTGRLLRFAGELSVFAADWTADPGPLLLDPQKWGWIENLLSALKEPSARLADLEPSTWDDALDHNRAFVLALDGIMPPAVGNGLLPRAAVMAGLRDREILKKNWAPLSAGSWIPPHSTPLPDGGVCHEFPLPRGGPDLGLAVTLGNQRWILGSSGSFTQSLAAAPTSPRGTASIQRIQIETAPWAAFADAWAGALEADPSLSAFTPGFLPASPRTWRAASALLRERRQFRYEARWEGPLLHRTAEIAPAP